MKKVIITIPTLVVVIIIKMTIREMFKITFLIVIFMTTYKHEKRHFLQNCD